MATRQELQVQQKRELDKKEEDTIPARVFLPTADIYETDDALNVVLEMPGVEKNSVDIRVEDGVLKIDGRLDFSKYQGLQPLYTEYNVGHYSRSFRLPSRIDQNKIAAELKDGVLSSRCPRSRKPGRARYKLNDGRRAMSDAAVASLTKKRAMPVSYGSLPVAKQVEHGGNNRFLVTLPSTAYSLLAPHLRTIPLKRGVILYEVEEKIEQVYFPWRGDGFALGDNAKRSIRRERFGGTGWGSRR